MSTRVQLTITSNNETVHFTRSLTGFTKARVRKFVHQPDDSITSPSLLKIRLGGGLNQVGEAQSSRMCFFNIPLIPNTPAVYSGFEPLFWDFIDQYGHPRGVDSLDIEILDASWQPLTMTTPVYCELEFS